MTREIPARRLEWLRGEVRRWEAGGLVDGAAAAAILDGYRPGRRASVTRLVSAIGAAFVGVGLISLVAANVDRMSPLLRFVGIATVWLAAVAVAEVLLRRDPQADDGHGSLGVGAARVVAVAAYGATLFQAAQSLQVPAYSSSLLGFWAVGALAYAYASRGIGPLVVGVATLVGWYAWTVGEDGDSAGAVIGSLLVAAVVATAVSVVHERTPLAHFAAPWAYAGALLALVGLFAAAVPAGDEPLDARTTLIGMAVAAVFAAGAIAATDTRGRVEVAASFGVLLAALLLTAWQPAESSGGADLSAQELAHAVVATVLYLATAIWFAVLGAMQDRPLLTNLATAALVVFVTVQSFGVFAPLLSGAALFLVVGVVLIAVGAVADRGRRRILEEVAE